MYEAVPRDFYPKLQYSFAESEKIWFLIHPIGIVMPSNYWVVF